MHEEGAGNKGIQFPQVEPPGLPKPASPGARKYRGRAGTVTVAFCAETPNILPDEDGEASRQTMDAYSAGMSFWGAW